MRSELQAISPGESGDTRRAAENQAKVRVYGGAKIGASSTRPFAEGLTARATRVRAPSATCALIFEIQHGGWMHAEARRRKRGRRTSDPWGVDSARAHAPPPSRDDKKWVWRPPSRLSEAGRKVERRGGRERSRTRERFSRLQVAKRCAGRAKAERVP